MTIKEYLKKVDGMTWSFSRLNSFANNCKYCWFQTYVESRKNESEDNFYSDFGKMVHEIHEDYYKDKLSFIELPDEFKRRCSYIENQPNNPSTAMKYYEGTLEYFNNFLDYDFVGDEYEIISIEEKVTLDIEGNKFIGFMDLVLRHKEQGYYVVFDHKSKDGFKNTEETQLYARQLYLYSQYVYEKYGEYPKMMVFNHFRTQTYTKIKFRESGMTEAKNWVLKVIKDIKEEWFFGVTDNFFFARNLCNFRSDEKHIQGEEYYIEDL